MEDSCDRCFHVNVCGYYGEECEEFADADRLSELAKADKDGRLVVLQCKAGDTVWVIENVFNGKKVVRTVGSRTIDEIKHNKLNKNTMISKQPFELHFYPSEIGKTVFLTRAEAEAALKGDSHAEIY